MITTTYVYDDPDHPNRVTQTIPSPAYTAEDRALLVGLEIYESDACVGCGHPRSVAWHSDMDGWFETDSYVCHGCTARRTDDQKAIYTFTRDTYPPDRVLRPFVLGQTTTPE